MESELSYYADEGITKYELESFRNQLHDNFRDSSINENPEPPTLNGAVLDLNGRDKQVVRLTRLAINISNKYRNGLSDRPGERDWVAQANCLDEQTSIFFPHNGRDYVAKLAICEACDVRVDCLAYALKRRDVNGIWGGTSGNERKVMIRDIKRNKLKKSEINNYVEELLTYEQD